MIREDAKRQASDRSDRPGVAEGEIEFDGSRETVARDCGRGSLGCHGVCSKLSNAVATTG